MLIRGNSMYPAYHPMQFVMLDKRSREYRQGDVIAFRCEGLHEVLVKRVAAGPGQTAVIRDGTLYVDGSPAPFYVELAFEYAGRLENEQKLLAGEYIVIGDNISESRDSRHDQVGIVRESDIIGKIIGENRH